MAKAPDEALPADVVPCKEFAMSDRFRDWAVGEMRREVLGQVRTAGLDRMALLKAKKKGEPGDGGAAGTAGAGPPARGG